MTRRDQKKRAERITEMWKRGATAPDVAEAFGVQKPAVYNALRRTGALPPYGKRPSRQSARMEAAGPIVVRDPCPRCGTRADIGCRHSSKSPLTSANNISAFAHRKSTYLLTDPQTQSLADLAEAGA